MDCGDPRENLHSPHHYFSPYPISQGCCNDTIGMRLTLRTLEEMWSSKRDKISCGVQPSKMNSQVHTLAMVGIPKMASRRLGAFYSPHPGPLCSQNTWRVLQNNLCCGSGADVGKKISGTGDSLVLSACLRK